MQAEKLKYEILFCYVGSLGKEGTRVGMLNESEKNAGGPVEGSLELNELGIMRS